MSEPRPRPRLRPCARCGGTSFLRVAPVREHGQGGEPIAMAATYIARARNLGPLARAIHCVGPKVALEPCGRFVVLVCTQCGDTRWFARELAAEVIAELPHAALGSCADCGDARSLRLGRARTRGHGGAPSELRVLTWTSRRWGFSTTGSAGHFDTFLCRGCGRTSWIAGGLDLRAQPARNAAPCTRCGGAARLTVDPVNEDGATLRVVYDKPSLREVRIGRYGLSICVSCGITDWSAHDLADLRPSPELGVALIHAGDEPGEGPYR